jgi:hypothetical protein
MYIANELKNLVPLSNIDGVRDSFIENLGVIVETFFADKTMFSMDDFSVHILDEYILETNCNKDIFSTIYLEIDQPLNYKPITKKKKNTNPNKYDIPEMYITLSEIKKGLHNCFTQHFDKNNIIWQDKYAICMKSSILLDDGQVESYYFRVVPAFTYYNNENVRGIVYYSNNDIQIEYPEQFILNFNKKNKQTKDRFRQIVLILKNILLKNDKIERLPSEIIETLVYNVPNEMLKDDNKQSIINLINFIRNNPLKSFKTIDEQDYAFASMNRSMSAFYCKHIMKIIENYLSKA